MDLKLKSRVNGEEAKCFRSIVEASDIAKYNLRCNRNLSEKMTKKDFIYDIRRPLQDARKTNHLKIQKKKSVLVPQEAKRKNLSVVLANGKLSKNRHKGGNAIMRLSVERILNYKCNFCNEKIATFSSLSTHVKFHCREYCRKCYWILEDGESMQKHFDRRHKGSSFSMAFVNSLQS